MNKIYEQSVYPARGRPHQDVLSGSALRGEQRDQTHGRHPVFEILYSQARMVTRPHLAFHWRRVYDQGKHDGLV